MRVAGFKFVSSAMHVSWCCDERRKAVLFHVGTSNARDWSLVKPNIEEQTSLCFTLRNNAGISHLFVLNMHLQLQKELFVIIPLYVLYMWQNISLATQRFCFFSLTPSDLSAFACTFQWPMYDSKICAHYSVSCPLGELH